MSPPEKVDGSGSTSDPLLETSTDRLSTPTYPGRYFSYRVTLAHDQSDRIIEVLRKYSNDWCMVAHNPDGDDTNPHFHCVMTDFTKKSVDAFKKRMCEVFGGKGNEFHAGKWRDNSVQEALTYFSHDPVQYYHSDLSWSDRIKDAPVWKPNVSGSTHRGPREKLGDPILTYSNVVKQALKYRTSHGMDTSSLGNVISRMVNQGLWIPSRELVTNGIPRELHEIFEARCVPSTKIEQDWMYPHDRSSKKLEWMDQPDKRYKIIHDPVAAARPSAVYKETPFD